MSEFNLTSRDLAKLKESWIDEDLARQARISRVNSQQGGQLVGRNGTADYAGIVFPYIWPGEERIREHRLRRDRPPVEQKSDGSTKEKEKYLSPPGRSGQLYFVPGTAPDQLGNERLPIVLTEGEKKTLALFRLANQSADASKFLPIGIAGVFNWRGVIGKQSGPDGERRDVKGVIPDIERVCWKGRKVLICFDSDLKSNFAIQRARSELARELRKRSATVLFLNVPPDGETKQGVDDWLSKPNGPNEVLAAMESASSSDVAGVPKDFIVNDTGVYCVGKVDGEGNQEHRFLCSRLDVFGFARKTNGESWSKMLRWKDRDHREHNWVMPNELLAGDGNEILKRLLSGGLEIGGSKKINEDMRSYIQRCRPADSYKLTQKVGWHESAFVFPDETIGPEGGEEVVYQDLDSDGGHFLRTAGTLDSWQESVSIPCAGNSRLVFAISAAFTGPLLRLCDEMGGGFHFRGGSSLGKSTALVVAGSVCGGGGKDGYLRSWRSTTNGIESVAVMHNDGLLCLDELQQIAESKAAAELVYTLANGFAKSRATRTGGARKAEEWRLLFLSSGEVSLPDLLKFNAQKMRGGQEIRMCDIPVDAGANLGVFETLPSGISDGAAFSVSLKKAATSSYGVAIRAFLEALVLDTAGFRKELDSFRQTFEKRYQRRDHAEEVGRVLARFSLVAAAGTLATRFGLTGWKENEAAQAAGRCFTDWLKNRGTLGAWDLNEAIVQIRSLIESSSNRFQRIARGGALVDKVPPRDQLGYILEGEKGQVVTYLFSPEQFKTVACAGHSYRDVLEELRRNDLLVMGSSDRYVVKQTINHQVQRGLYGIRGAILWEDDSDSM